MKPRRFRAYTKNSVPPSVKCKSLPEQPAEAEGKKKYAEDQKRRMSGYKIGSLDPSGNKIVKVFSKGDDFMVYEIDGASESESFRVLVDTVVESDPDGYIQRYEKIKSSIDEFRSILHQGVHDKSVKHRAATAVSTALRGDHAAAKVIFDKINQQVQGEYKNISNGRFNYLISAFAAVLLLMVVSCVVYVSRDSGFISHNPLLKRFLYAAFFAGLGGFLSICINLKDIEFERSLDGWKYEVYGLQRIILAASCGVIAYLLIASDILLSFMTKSPNATLAIMAICVLSGFSEKLIPNALRRLESKED